LSEPTGDEDAKVVSAGSARTVADEPHAVKLDLLGEELVVAKEEIETGRIRVTTQTRAREALIDENLIHEHAEIETVPIGRRVFELPTIRHEGDTTIVPVIEEVLFTERRLMLKEEVRIKRVRTTEHYQDRVTLRRQEAVITRIHGSAEQADIVSANDKKPTNVEE
jgi:stress response protein YsnF